MFSRVRIAIRFFFVGLAVGVLLAPRSGEETRRMVREKADRLLNDVLDAATLGTFESGAGARPTRSTRRPTHAPRTHAAAAERQPHAAARAATAASRTGVRQPTARRVR